MKILFFSNEFPRPEDPLRSVFNLRMCEALAATHEVRVFSPVAWTERRRRARTPGPRAFAGLTVTHSTYFFPPRILAWLRGRFMWWSVRRALLAFTADWTPDVILAYWTHPDGEVAQELGARLGVPVVQMVGGSDVLLCPRTGQRWQRVRSVLASAAAVVTMGKHLAREVVAAGVPTERVTALYRPVDASKFVPGNRGDARNGLGLPPDSRIVLWVGRFVDVKGIDVLIDAMARVRAAMPDVLLCLIGKGPREGNMRSRVAAAGLGDVVRFIGPVAHLALVCWYRAADVFVLPSYSEGVPNVLLESIACGLPFVASAVGGVPEIAHPRFDRLTPAGDAAALAQALEEILSLPAGSRERPITTLTPERFARQLEAVLADAIHPDAREAAVAS